MLDIEESLNTKFPHFAQQSQIIRKPTLSLLRRLTYEEKINDFLIKNAHCHGLEFIDRIFDYFNFSYSVSSQDRRNIPAQGRVVIIANHPIGSLDGLALLHLVSEVRRDVKIVANDMLTAFKPLQDLLLPLDNMTRRAYRQSYGRVMQALESGEAIIIFPAGEVSRARPTGVRDGAWRAGFLHFARKAQAPLLPVHIAAKNSLLFYSVSAIYKPFGTALLAHEMFNKQSAEIRFRIGDLIPCRALQADSLADTALIQRLKKQVYKIGKGRKPIFVVEKTIAHPEDRAALSRELKTATLLGRTRDNQAIYLCDYHRHPSVLREVGRLRELTFRRVGEGTGRRRDLDDYDSYYHHLVLWDEANLAIAGAYRMGQVADILEQRHLAGLYTTELFNYAPEALPYLHQAVELGRSFVNPDYWGRASLDYLWQGLGAYLRHYPNLRYLLGPVSLSADYPKPLQDLLVCYFQRFYKGPTLASPRQPQQMDAAVRMANNALLAKLDRESAFDYLQQRFTEAGYKIPALFKHYAAVFEEGGYQLLAFNIDPDFGHCLDGLFMGDLNRMNPRKRRRYLGDAVPCATPAEPLST